MKIWSLFEHETMITGNKIMWKSNVEKRRNCSWGAISPLFHIIIIYISNFRSQISYSFVKCGCSIYCFPHSLNSDMSRYGYLEVFQWPLGIRDNESRLYITVIWWVSDKPRLQLSSFYVFFFHFFSFSCKLKSLRGLDTLGRSTLKETFRSPCKFFTFR